jgi:hypothetical protein
MRSGLGRLLRSTKSATRAQQLNDLAMKISLGTGADYAKTVLAVAKANEGNGASLKKLVGPLGNATQNYIDLGKATDILTGLQNEAADALDKYGPKSEQYASAMKKVNKQLDKVNTIKGSGGIKWVAELNKQFSGAIAADAATYAGKMRRVGTAWSELQEAYGGGVIGNGRDLGNNMDDLATSMYNAQPAAETLGQDTAILAQNLIDIAGVIGPVVSGLSSLGDNFLFQSWSDIAGNAVNMPKRLAAQLTGNAQAAYETGFGRTPQTVAPNATGSASRPFTVDPTRYAINAAIAAARADARAAARRAKTGARP